MKESISMNMKEVNDQFEFWLMDMDDALERFRQELPLDDRDRLDYSAESLDFVEALALSGYPGVQEAKAPTEAKRIDQLARYVGQVFRKHLGGKWSIDFSDPKNAFYGLPQLSGLDGQRAQVCPLTLITASLDRRTGKFLRMVFENNLRNATRT
jgi:hypothetical protein